VAVYERGECDCAEFDPTDMVDLFMGTASHIVEKRAKESAARMYGHKADQQPAAVAPAGADDVVRKVCGRLDRAADYAHTITGETVGGAVSHLPAVLARALSEALAQQPAAEDEVVFIDGVGAGRSSVKSCHDGVQWIRVGDRVYWPLSDSDAKRLQSAC